MSTFYEHREEKVFIGEMTQYPFPVHVHEVAEIIAVTTGSIRISIDSIFLRLFEHVVTQPGNCSNQRDEDDGNHDLRALR